MILFGHIDIILFILADVMPFNVWISLTDVIIKVCVEDIILHLADVIALCEMALPHLLLDMWGAHHTMSRTTRTFCKVLKAPN